MNFTITVENDNCVNDMGTIVSATVYLLFISLPIYLISLSFYSNQVSVRVYLLFIYLFIICQKVDNRISFLRINKLYCVVLFCTVLYCIVLYCTVLLKR